ncbi:45180_t:CDS:2 [Gigaspora margarita]|uniref:45180_t:CDS:1 n=1 Tax=Gigaspora margarita TaxID=4874 RepID=A0ABN7VA98_GIGMA|nr:45180_t:CDS:2 [Gigaspora margarita]
MFEENGFDIYMHHEIIEVDISEKNKAERALKHRQLVVNELMEKTRDVYWRIKKKGNEKQTGAFIRDLKSRLEPILYNAKI